MSDERANRKPKVVASINHQDNDIQFNFAQVLKTAKLLKMEGFEANKWEDSTWKVTGGRLVKLTGKNPNSASFNFCFSPGLGGGELDGEWADICKALFVLRFHRKHQSAPNQRFFITAVGYVAHAATNLGMRLRYLSPEALNDACRLIAQHYSHGVAYNLHKAVAEFAGHCDANRMCQIVFQFKYSAMKRPKDAGGLHHIRLDDPEVLETRSGKLVAPGVYRVIGELYQKVPKDHKYRFYVLVLTLLCCLGRRFSEISLLPYQQFQTDKEGLEFLEYFPRKGRGSNGDLLTPRRRLYMPTHVLPIVKEVITELEELCAPARDTAAEMMRANDVDLRFLGSIAENKRLYPEDLTGLGISATTLRLGGWIRENGYTKADLKKTTKRGRLPSSPIHYTSKTGVIAYCQQDFSLSSLTPIHIDQSGQKLYLKDLMLVRYVGLSSGAYTCWAATQCTHSMMTTFLRYFADLAREFTSEDIEANFTSHHFRHTLSTLLDEGGLSDLLQTEWFGRSNPHDTKTYQHTSREKRALMLREEIKSGNARGKVVEQLKYIPVTAQEAFLNARVRAVHDVGPGLCIHNFTQIPCQRHLQCQADCEDYVWTKDDLERVEDIKRQYAVTALTREAALERTKKGKPGKSADWLTHNDKKLEVLQQQLIDNGVQNFDPKSYMQEKDGQEKRG